MLLPGGGNLLRIRANYISGTAVSGVRGNQTTFMLDGADVTDHHQGGSLIQTSVDALQEFKVQQSAYTAEFRRPAARSTPPPSPAPTSSTARCSTSCATTPSTRATSSPARPRS